MSDIAIRCEGPSKRYKIGEQERYKALRDVITDAAAAPSGSSIRNSSTQTEIESFALGPYLFRAGIP